ncbi:MAG: hypothetical protein AAB836_00840 [Patescibacteria group bacterium]
MKKSIIIIALVTTLITACSKNEPVSNSTKMEPKPISSDTGAQIISPDLK